MLLLQLTIANLKMIARNRQSLFWSLMFPVIMVVIFGLIGQERNSATTIALVDYANDGLSRQLAGSLREVPAFRVETRADEATARQDIRDGDLGYLLIIPDGFQSAAYAAPPAPVTIVYDNTNQFSSVVIGAVERFLDRMNMDIAGASSSLTLRAEGVLSEDFRFIEFVIPGVAIWGIMSFSVIGIATSIANYREKKILLRIKATPIKVRVFFMAQVAAYLLLSMVQAVIILGMGVIVYDLSVGSNVALIAPIILFGNIAFLNLGFIVGAFSKSVAAASGLGNVVVMPMLMFSGVFFPSELLPGVLANAMRFLPLAPVVDAVRGVTLESKTILDYPFEMGIIAIWVVLTSFVAVRVFKFD